MLRLTGIALLCAALSAAGFLYIAAEKRKVDALQEALYAVKLLRIEVTRLLLPPGRAIAALAGQNKLLKQLHEAGCPLEGEALRSALLRFGLGKEEAAYLEALFVAWPRLSAGQSAPFDAAEEQLNQRLIQRKKALEQNAALYPKLGVLAAAAAFLLLI